MYQALLRDKLEALHTSGQYWYFTTLNRVCGRYPMAHLADNDDSEVIVWCSNDCLGLSQHQDVRTAMHDAVDSLLDRKDRMNMAVGLEVRVPLCDHRLVEYAFNIPWEIKAFDGREKCVLRAATRDLLPASISDRVKIPYPSTLLANSAITPLCTTAWAWS